MGELRAEGERMPVAKRCPLSPAMSPLPVGPQAWTLAGACVCGIVPLGTSVSSADWGGRASDACWGLLTPASLPVCGLSKPLTSVILHMRLVDTQSFPHTGHFMSGPLSQPERF